MTNPSPVSKKKKGTIKERRDKVIEIKVGVD